MESADFDEVAELIYLSTNGWYERHLGHAVFQCDPSDCRVFPEVYEDLDPECGIVVENEKTGHLAGSCFFHPREMHVSLGILNVHPSYFGHGIAGRILNHIIEEAETRGLPLRLVSSALNLDSFSLYSRAGFNPYAIYQDMILLVPDHGLDIEPDKSLPEVRPALPSDVDAMGKIEFDVSGISRELDYCYFIDNNSEIWQTMVSLDKDGEIDGFLVSVDCPASSMIGPGVARNAASAEALLIAQLDRFRGRQVVFLLPADETGLVSRAYEFGARNCELHFAQVLGDAQPVNGIVMPTFLPETG
jgi:GNAT superfamily N-acetyltransferase